MTLRWHCLLTAFFAWLLPAPAGAAGGSEPCPLVEGCLVAGGHYRVHAPPDWDGARPLPALIHFHGFRESAEDMMARADITAFTDRNNILFIAPHGAGNTWSHPGSPSQNRDEFAFIDAVMADVARRFPLDRERVLVSGFSQGAAMVWNLACYRGDRFSAFLAIAGTFWRPQPDSCPSGARTLIQVHGVADRTVPLEGRSIRQIFRQGDVFRAMAMMRRANACGPETISARRIGPLACEIAEGCDSGQALAFCLHPGGHDFDPSWYDFAWDFINRDKRP
jgi:polyhydroxybutyrate depolymerase